MKIVKYLEIQDYGNSIAPRWSAVPSQSATPFCTPLRKTFPPIPSRSSRRALYWQLRKERCRVSFRNLLKAKVESRFLTQLFHLLHDSFFEALLRYYSICLLPVLNFLLLTCVQRIAEPSWIQISGIPLAGRWVSIKLGRCAGNWQFATVTGLRRRS